MVRPALDDFIHRVTITPLEERGSDGIAAGTPRTDRPAIVDSTAREVTDQRTDSDTYGQKVIASALVGVFLEDYIVPGMADVVIFPGTPAERTGRVVASGYFDHPEAPEHAELWLV